MTTIAANQDGMAADTQLTGEYNYRVQKIHRLEDGTLVGGSGCWARCYAGIKWLIEGAEGDPPKIRGACLLILRPDRTLWIAEGEFPAYPLLDKWAAIGSGSQAAASLMANGAAPADAIKQVCRIEANTSEPVQYLQLEPPAKPARKRANRGMAV